MGKGDSGLLLIVRHGRAEEDHPSGDFARGLDEKGREKFRAHARDLSERVRLRGIATSPLVRAVQTAEILADACGVAEVRVRSELEPGPRADEQIAGLARELGEGWALVGHEPSLSGAAELLLGGGRRVELKKGAAIALRPGGKKFAFAWLAAPGEPVQEDG
jgi:phosphohistidine phosphatase